MNSWQDLVANYKPTWAQPPANLNTPPTNVTPIRQGPTPLGAFDSYKNVGDWRARQMSPAEMNWQMPDAGNKNRTPYEKLLNPDPDIEDIIAQQVFNIAKRMLPLPVQAGLTAGTAIMTPTRTAPPEMDEAPPWSWPSQ